jgi:PAS domain S-box-containing protein
LKSKPVILIVDDQPQNIDLLEAHLAQQGYEIVKATNGEEALEILSENQVDLILLDVRMPGLDGYEVTRRVRQDDTHQQLPIILVTVLRDTEDRLKGIEAGCDDFISSPVDKMELLARVRSLLKVKAYNDLMSHYRKELESEVNLRTEELKQTLEHLQQDTAKRKLAEEALRESEERYRFIFERATDGMLLIDLENQKINDANDSMSQMLGYSLEELKKLGTTDIRPKEELPFVEEQIQIQSSDELAPAKDIPMRRKDGSVFYANVHEAPIMLSGKKYLMGVFRDITKRRLAEAELLEAKALVDAVVENVPLMIFLKEATDLRFVIFNRAGEELLGYDRKALLGKNNLDLFPPEQAAHFMAKDREALAGQGMVDIPEEPILTAKKGQRLLHTRKICILGADGATKYLLGISEDITERKRAEEAIQASLREKEILLREIHHRVKNNMQIISSLFNLQAGHVKDKDAHRMLKEGQLRIRSMALVHEKLYQSRDLSKIDFADYLRSLSDHLFRFFRIDAGRIRLETDLEQVHLDINSAIPCGLLVTELMTNALTHAFPGKRKGVIGIRLLQGEDGIVELRVTDDGVGFPKAVDFRHTESLGLQIVSLLVGQLEGTIELDRKGGTAFTIAFRELEYKART